MIELEELQELSELKAMLKEHSIDYDYPEVFRMLEKLASIINKKSELIKEDFRLKEYGLHCYKQAIQEKTKEIRRLEGKSDE